MVVGGVGVRAVVAQGCRTAARRGTRRGSWLSDGWGVGGRLRGGSTDVGLIGNPPVGCDGPLSRGQTDGALTDQAMKLVLDDVLDPSTLGGVIGLRPQVGFRVRRAPDLQRDDVVLLVVTGRGITLVGVTGRELLHLESGRDR